MKRRSFLKFIGIAPVVAAVPAIAAPSKPVPPFQFDELTGQLNMNVASLNVCKAPRAVRSLDGKFIITDTGIIIRR